MMRSLTSQFFHHNTKINPQWLSKLKCSYLLQIHNHLMAQVKFKNQLVFVIESPRRRICVFFYFATSQCTYVKEQNGLAIAWNININTHFTIILYYIPYLLLFTFILLLSPWVNLSIFITHIQYSRWPSTTRKKPLWRTRRRRGAESATSVSTTKLGLWFWFWQWTDLGAW